MRDFQLQTPQRDQAASANRRPKSTSELKRNLGKVAKKSLNPAFKSVAEDDSAISESLKEFSEVSDDNLFGESDENLIALGSPVDTRSSETVAISALNSTPLSSSSVITSDAVENKCKSPEVDSFNKIESIEAEVVIKYLREARVQVLKSKDVGPSKKLLDALINIVIEEFYGGLYGENEWLDKLLSSKAILVFLSFMMVIFAIFMFWSLNSGVKGFIGPTPT